MLTSKQRAQLRGLAATEDTIVHIGKGGITDNIVTQMNDALKARELVKGRVLENSLLTAISSPRSAVPSQCRSLARNSCSISATSKSRRSSS